MHCLWHPIFSQLGTPLLFCISCELCYLTFLLCSILYTSRLVTTLHVDLTKTELDLACNILEGAGQPSVERRKGIVPSSLQIQQKVYRIEYLKLLKSLQSGVNMCEGVSQHSKFELMANHISQFLCNHSVILVRLCEDVLKDQKVKLPLLPTGVCFHLMFCKRC